MKRPFLCLLLFMSGLAPYSAAAAPNKALAALFEDYYRERMRLYPLEATANAEHRYDDRLPNDISESYRDTLRSFYRSYLDRLSSVDEAKLDPQDRTSYDIFKREMEISLNGFRFHDHLMPLNQFWGTPLTMGQLGSGSGNHPFRTVTDYRNFLSRIDGFAVWCDTAVANMRRGMAMGYVVPKILVERMLPQMSAMLVDEPAKSIFYDPVKNMPESFSAEQRRELTGAYTEAIRAKIIPSYAKLHDFLKNEYMSAARSSSGISAVPDGKDYYAYLTRYWTTTELGPEEIFAMGEREVARIRAEMEAVRKQVGFTGTLQEFFSYLNTDSRFMPYRTDREVLAAYANLESIMRPQLRKIFNLVPKAKFEVRQTEAFRAASASAEYNPPAPDGSRPGIFYIPIVDPAKHNNVSMESLFLHEAIPGHHYQISIQQEQKDLPEFRRFIWYGAHGEGWALYSEGLGRELGLYTDPYQYFGRLINEMHRAIRLVVDVGMHTKGWTREQAIRYSTENEAVTEADAAAEIERYMAIPGQALSYKVGELKILELRRRAEKALGAKFSLAKFHDQVLEDGCLPLSLLERKVDRWIQGQL